MAISKFERNLVTPTSKTLGRLAVVLDTRIEFFFRRDGVVLEEIRYCSPASLPRKQRVRVEADVPDLVAAGEDVEAVASEIRSA